MACTDVFHRSLSSKFKVQSCKQFLTSCTNHDNLVLRTGLFILWKPLTEQLTGPQTMIISLKCLTFLTKPITSLILVFTTSYQTYLVSIFWWNNIRLQGLTHIFNIFHNRPQLLESVIQVTYTWHHDSIWWPLMNLKQTTGFRMQ